MIGRTNAQMSGGKEPEVILTPSKWAIQQPTYTLTKLSGDYWAASHTTIKQPSLSQSFSISLAKYGGASYQEGSTVTFNLSRTLKRVRIFYKGVWSSSYSIDDYYVSINGTKLSHADDSEQYIDLDINSDILRFDLFSRVYMPADLSITITAIEELQ